jgi:hypothetical protein
MKSVGFCGMGVNKVKEAGKTLYQHIAAVGLAFLLYYRGPREIWKWPRDKGGGGGPA